MCVRTRREQDSEHQEEHAGDALDGGAGASELPSQARGRRQPEGGADAVVENSGHGGTIAAPKAGYVLSHVLIPDSLAAMHRIVASATRETSLVHPDTTRTETGIGD